MLSQSCCLCRNDEYQDEEGEWRSLFTRPRVKEEALVLLLKLKKVSHHNLQIALTRHAAAAVAFQLNRQSSSGALSSPPPRRIFVLLRGEEKI